MVHIDKFVFALSIVILFTTELCGQSLLPINENGLYGFMDTAGKIVIPPRFPAAGIFAEGLAPARLEGLYGYIDTTGVWEIEPRFDFAESFRNGLAHVFVDGKPFVIDRRGTVLFDHNFVEIGKFVNSYAVVSTSGGRQGIVDRNGLLAVDTIHASVSLAHEGVAVIENDTGTGVIDMQGKMIAPFGTFTRISPFSNGYAHVRDNRRFAGLINTEGKMIKRFDSDKISPHYQYPDFSGGVAVVEVDENRTGLIDTTGRLLFSDPTIKAILPFQTDRSFGRTPNFRWIMLDIKGNKYNTIPYKRVARNSFVKDLAAVATDEGWMIIDKQGKNVAGPLDIDAEETVLGEEVLLFHQRLPDDTWKWGFWNFTTDTIIESRFDYLALVSSHPSLLTATEEQRLAYLDVKGKYVWREEPVESPVGPNVDFMLRGYCYASSDVESASVGWGGSRNRFRPIEEAPFLPDGFSLVVIHDDTTRFADRYRGMKLYIANRTSHVMLFQAQDSRLHLKLQAQDERGEWRDIEHLPFSWCGNSYHTLSLPPDSYWSFTIPVYEGGFRTRLRAELTYVPDSTVQSHSTNALAQYESGGIIYSNEFEGSINPGQFWRKKIYSPQGIMDPYND